MTAAHDELNNPDDSKEYALIRKFCGRFSPVSAMATIAKMLDGDGDAYIDLGFAITSSNGSMQLLNHSTYNIEQFAEAMRIMEDLRSAVTEFIDKSREMRRDIEMEDMLG